MPSSTQLRSLSIALFAWALIAGAPAFAQHVHVGYGGGWHGGYGWRGGYYGGYHGGYYGGWRGGYYGWGGGYYYGPWGWWGGYGLPYYYSAYGWGGAPYYYADNDYGTSAPSGAMANPGRAVSAGPAQQPVVYPKNGQSQEQQGKDTYECHRWAVGQTGFDPTQGTPGNRAEYFRAQAACLEGRGYAVN